jgi:hypothetical protein
MDCVARVIPAQKLRQSPRFFAINADSTKITTVTMAGAVRP